MCQSIVILFLWCERDAILRFLFALTFSFMFMFSLLLLLLLLFSLLTVLMTDTEKKVAEMRKPKKGKMTKVPQWPGS